MAVFTSDTNTDRLSSLRLALVSLALANLVLLPAWGTLLNPGNAYFLKTAPRWQTLLALWFDVAVLATILGCGFWLARRSKSAWPKTLARLTFLALLLISLNGIRQRLSVSFPLTASLAGFVGAVALVFWWLRAPVQVVRVAVGVLVATSPLVAIETIEAASLLLAEPAPILHAEPFAVAPGARRVVWLLFDQLDYRLVFERRPNAVELPELDRFVAGSIHATHAVSPGASTGRSLPSLITGRVVREVDPVRDDLELTFDDGERVPWSQAPNIFAAAGRSGLNTALVGWYHPYCRILGKDLTRCSWYPYVFDTHDFAMRAWRNALLAFNSVPFAFRLGLIDDKVHFGVYDIDRAWHARQYRRILEDAISAATDPSLGLVFVHFPIPHQPFIFDRRKNRIDVISHSDYRDNLELVDQTLRQLRTAMEKASLWDGATVVLTSDHSFDKSRPLRDEWLREQHADWLGTTDARVPVIVKLPGQRQGLRVDAPFNSIALHDFVLDVLADRVHTTADAAAVLQAAVGSSTAASASSPD